MCRIGCGAWRISLLWSRQLRRSRESVGRIGDGPMKLNLDDPENAFLKEVADELKVLAEAFSDRSVAEDARKAQDLSIIASMLTILYQAGLITISKVQGAGLEGSVSNQSTKFIALFLCLTAFFFTARYYLYYYNDSALTKMKQLVAGLRMNTLNRELMNAISDDKLGDMDKRRAGAAHATLADLTSHLKWGRRGRGAVDLIFPAALWIAAAGLVIWGPQISN